ncbi:MAG: hypothetical protein QXD03_04450 [Candidatus Anstonellales archaeon]
MLGILGKINSNGNVVGYMVYDTRTGALQRATVEEVKNRVKVERFINAFIKEGGTLHVIKENELNVYDVNGNVVDGKAILAIGVYKDGEDNTIGFKLVDCMGRVKDISYDGVRSLMGKNRLLNISTYYGKNLGITKNSVVETIKKEMVAAKENKEEEVLGIGKDILKHCGRYIFEIREVYRPENILPFCNKIIKCDREVRFRNDFIYSVIRALKPLKNGRYGKKFKTHYMYAYMALQNAFGNPEMAAKKYFDTASDIRYHVRNANEAIVSKIGFVLKEIYKDYIRYRYYSLYRYVMERKDTNGMVVLKAVPKEFIKALENMNTDEDIIKCYNFVNDLERKIVME